MLEVIARKERVLIEGVRMIKRHLKKSQDNPQGKIAEREGPIHISNVKVLERAERKGKKESEIQGGKNENASQEKGSQGRGVGHEERILRRL